jgi:isopentenyl-diphosphate delta-isomerase
MTNQLIKELGDQVKCKHFIVSGGVQTFLDGYYYTQKLNQTSIYGQASAFLRYAQEDYNSLRSFTAAQVRGLELARAYLHIK